MRKEKKNKLNSKQENKNCKENIKEEKYSLIKKNEKEQRE